jgi:hypothetical protein
MMFDIDYLFYLAQILEVVIDKFKDDKIDICEKICNKLMSLEIINMNQFGEYISNTLIKTRGQYFANHFTHYFTDIIINGFDSNNMINIYRCLGNSSTNAVVLKGTYKVTSQYVMEVIIKHTTSQELDNLYYEYLVGKCVNELNRDMPFFCKTYGIYKVEDKRILTTLPKYCSKTPDQIVYLNTITNVTASDLKTQAKKSCQTYAYGVVIETVDVHRSLGMFYTANIGYVDSARSIKFRLDKIYNFVEIYNSLLLVYTTLDKFKDYFTHYDLHPENVLLYKIPENKYVNITIDDDLTFRTKFLPIIIDYGRAYIKCDNFESSSFMSEVVQDDECRPPSTKGYPFLGMYSKSSKKFNDTDATDYFINIAKRNISHDLRLLYSMSKRYLELKELIKPMTELSGFLKKLDALHDIQYINIYGTPEITSRGSTGVKRIINVSDAYECLRDLISTEGKNIMDKAYEMDNCFGTLKLYKKTPKKYQWLF